MSVPPINVTRAFTRTILQSQGVREACAQAGERIASEARSKTDNEIIVVNAGRSRARTYVRMLGPLAAADEVRSRPLGSSIP